LIPRSSAAGEFIKIRYREENILNNITKSNLFMARMLAVLLVVIFFAFPFTTDAKQEVSAVPGASYNVHSTLAENLKTFMGKRVSVTLDCGKIFTGFVKEVGNHLVHLEKLDGKDYFDALILIDRIDAMDTRFRELPR
jgi:hypothetical protein